MMDELLLEIQNDILRGDASAARLGVCAAVEADLPAVDILDTMTLSMAEVGNRFEAGEYFVPDLLVAARAMQEGMQVLRPRLVQADVRSAGLVVAGTVKGDLHEIGKNLVCMLLECAGFAVVNLGMDVTPEQFVEAVIEHQPHILAMSALLTTTMPNQGATIEALRKAGVRERVKVMVGGAPLTERYARELGADGYAPDASQAVKLAKSLVAIQ
jgi:5-methyltetrahydrofolate--homocysteine methyltransferase